MDGHSDTTSCLLCENILFLFVHSRAESCYWCESSSTTWSEVISSLRLFTSQCNMQMFLLLKTVLQSKLCPFPYAVHLRCFQSWLFWTVKLPQSCQVFLLANIKAATLWCSEVSMGSVCHFCGSKTSLESAGFWTDHLCRWFHCLGLPLYFKQCWCVWLEWKPADCWPSIRHIVSLVVSSLRMLKICTWKLLLVVMNPHRIIT